MYLIDKYISLCGFEGLERSENKKRGYILINKENCTYYCHNCNISISFSNFLKQYKPHLFKEYNKEMFMDKLGFKTKEQKEEPKIINPKKPVDKFLLGKLQKAYDNKEALSYCNKRKFLESFINSLYYTDNYIKFLISNNLKPESHYSYISDYDKRIVIPIYNKNKELVMIQGRSIEDNKMRYITISLKENEIKIWGEDKINKNNDIYVFEGVFDAHFIPNSLAMLGSSVSYDYLIKNYDSKKLIFVFDNDIKKNKQIKSQANKVIKLGCKIVIWPKEFGYKDINEAVMSGYNESKIKKFVELNTYKGLEAEVRIKLL